MKIIVNNIAASSSGALSILTDFYNFVLKNHGEHEWIFLLSKKHFEENENVKILTFPQVKKSRVKKLLFDFFYGARIINKMKPDVVFSMQNIITFGVNAPQVLYVHQAIPFQDEIRFSFIKKDERHLAVYQHLISKLIFSSIRKASKVIVQTNTMKEEIVKKLKVSADKISYVYPQINPEIPKSTYQSFESNLFFYPAISESYKKHSTIINACNILLRNSIRNFEIFLTIEGKSTDNIKYMGKIPRSMVYDLYSKSVLIFPSAIESYPLPLVEAMTCNSIILCADTAYSREILMNYPNAFFFPLDDSQKLAQLIESVINGSISKIKVSFSQDTKGWSEVINQIIKLKNNY